MGLKKLLSRPRATRGKSNGPLQSSISNTEHDEPSTAQTSAAYKTAMTYMKAQKECDFVGGGERCCAPNFIVKFVGCQDDGSTDTEMPGEVFHQFEAELVESFPDFKKVWESITEVEPGVIVVKGLTVSATHTGKPYAFGDYPKIPATGKRVQDPILKATMYVDKESGKLTRYVIDSFGKNSGPPNFYTSIGGLMM